MGSFFTNVHVYAPMPREVAVVSIADAIRASVLSGPFREARPDEVADRTISIAADDSPHWFVVYDEETESQEPKVLATLSAALSRPPLVASMSVQVTDSDQLAAVLYRNGRVADRFATPGHKGRRKALKARAWQEWLDIDALAKAEAALSTDSPFAEDCLETWATLFAWNQDLAHVGHRYLGELAERPLVRLRFQSVQDPSHVRFRTGPPVLEGETTRVARMVAGGPLDGLFATIYNEGGGGTGIAAIIPWTHDLSTLMKIESLRLSVGERLELELPFEIVEHGPRQFLRASAPKVVLHPWPKWIGPESEFSMMRFNRLLQRGRLWPSLQGKALRAGAAELTVVYVPHANPEEGARSVRYSVTIEEGAISNDEWTGLASPVEEE